MSYLVDTNVLSELRRKFDGLLAATALQHDLTLVTRNTKDFEGLGVQIVNPREM